MKFMVSSQRVKKACVADRAWLADRVNHEEFYRAYCKERERDTHLRVLTTLMIRSQVFFALR